MKKKGLIVAAIVLVVLTGSVFGYRGVKEYRITSDPLTHMLYHSKEMRTFEGSVQASLEIKEMDDILPDLGEDDENRENIVFGKKVAKKLMKNLTIESKIINVFDQERDDMGYYFDGGYYYDGTPMFLVAIQTDFERMTLGLPQLLNKPVMFGLDKLKERIIDSEVDWQTFDLKPYIKILLDGKSWEKIYRPYFEKLQVFLNDGHLEKMGKNEVELADGQKVKATQYKITVTHEEYLDFYFDLLSQMQQDEKVKQMVLDKLEALYNKFVESKDYEAAGLTEEEAKAKYDELVAKVTETFADEQAISKWRENLEFSQEESVFKGEKAQKIQQKIKRMTYQIVVSIDKDKYIRRIDLVADSELMAINETIFYHKFGQNVSLPEMTAEDKSYASSEFTEDRGKLVQNFGGEIIDNLSQKVIGGKAFEKMVADIIKEIKQLPEGEQKDDLMSQFESLTDNLQKQLNSFKVFLN